MSPLSQGKAKAYTEHATVTTRHHPSLLTATTRACWRRASSRSCRHSASSFSAAGKSKTRSLKAAVAPVAASATAAVGGAWTSPGEARSSTSPLRAQRVALIRAPRCWRSVAAHETCGESGGTTITTINRSFAGWQAQQGSGVVKVGPFVHNCKTAEQRRTAAISSSKACTYLTGEIGQRLARRQENQRLQGQARARRIGQRLALAYCPCMGQGAHLRSTNHQAAPLRLAVPLGKI